MSGERPPTSRLVGATFLVCGAILLLIGAVAALGLPGLCLALGAIFLLLAYMAF